MTKMTQTTKRLRTRYARHRTLYKIKNTTIRRSRSEAKPTAYVWKQNTRYLVTQMTIEKLQLWKPWYFQRNSWYWYAFYSCFPPRSRAASRKWNYSKFYSFFGGCCFLGCLKMSSLQKDEKLECASLLQTAPFRKSMWVASYSSFQWLFWIWS